MAVSHFQEDLVTIPCQGPIQKVGEQTRAQALSLRFRGNAQIEELSFMSHCTQDAVAEEHLPRHQDPAFMILTQAVAKMTLGPGRKVSRPLHNEHGGKIR